MRNLIVVVVLGWSSASAMAADAFDLHRAVKQACECEVVGVVIGKRGDPSSVTVTYAAGTSKAARSAGDAVMRNFDMTAASIPQVVQKTSVMLAMSRSSVLDAANAWVKSQPDETKIIWESATELRRDSPFMVNLAKAIGLSSAQADALFVTAKAISPP